jgi:membrane-bound ClpP family serine protease
MVDTTPGRPHCLPHDREHAGRLALAAVMLVSALAPGVVHAQDLRGSGLVVAVPNVITTESTNRLRGAVYGPLKRFEAERARDPRGVFWLVCDFNPDGRPNASDDYGACRTLAGYLRDRRQEGVRTVAFVHGDVTRHAVLAVLACSEMVMSEDPPARLGAVAGPGHGLEKDERLFYEELARNRYPLAVVRKMFDPDLTLFKAPPGAPGERYLDSSVRPLPAGAEPVAEPARGEPGLYTFAQARDFGLCRQTPCGSVDDLVETYHLGRASVAPPLDRAPVAWRVIARGAIDGELREKLKRRIRRALGQGANLLVVELRCGDGDAAVAHDLGLYLARLNDDRPGSPVETVAFVTREARNTAAFLALGCGRIVMQREQRQNNSVVQPGARLGEFDRFLAEQPALEPRLRHDVVEVARKQHYPAVLAEGLVAHDLRIHLVESVKGGSARRFLSEDELRDDQRGERRWRSVEVVWPKTDKDRGHPMTLSADRAVELGLADEAVADFADFRDKEGLRAGQVSTSDSDWLDDLADFLRDPWTSVVLIMVGITCLILELKMPGAVMPGVIAALCFVLFFWSHSQLAGQVTWLAVLLFLLGLVLIGLEVFVLPGFGVAGVSGIVLVVGSLGLMAYGHWPQGPEEWSAFGQRLAPFGVSILGALVCAFVLARYLPSIPYVNRLILRPHEEAEEGAEDVADSLRSSEAVALLGAIGVAATPLRPAGKAQFGETFLDVVAEGGYVVPGTRVQVIEIEGNRVVVKEV